MKRRLFWALAVLLLLPLIHATCPFLDVSISAQSTVVQGNKATFPLAFVNRDLYSKIIQVSGICPENTGCGFTPEPFKVLEPSASTTLTLSVDTAQTNPGNHSIPLDINVDGAVCQSFTLRLEIKPATQTVKPPFEFIVTPASNQSARPQDVLTYKIQIRNNQNERAFVRVFAESELPVDFSVSDLSLEPESEKIVTANIRPNAGTPRNRYDVLFRVDAFDGSGCCERPYAFARQIFVFSDNLDLALQNVPTSCIYAEHEKKTDWVFQVRNNGEATGPFYFSIEGLPAAVDFAKLDTSLLTIVSGDAQALTVSLIPPQSIELRRYNLRLRAVYNGFTVFERPFCVDVDAVRSFKLSGPHRIFLVRGESVKADFPIQNTGTIQQTFTVYASASPKLDLRAVTNTLTLNPGQTKNATLIIASSLMTPLYNNQSVLLRVFDGKVTKSVNATLDISSSLRPGKSFLDIITKPVTAYAGIKTNQKVSVRNRLSRTQQSVILSIHGLDASLAQVNTEPINILAGKTATFEVEFTPPDTATGIIPYTYRASSKEKERVEVSNVVEFKAPPAFLNVAVTNVVRRGDEVSFSVVVFNNGARPLNDVVVQASDKTLTLDRLAPGEQRIVAFQALAAAPLIVKARSGEGIESNTQTVNPEEKPADAGTDAMLFAIVILALVLLAISFMLRKEHLDRLNQSTG